MTSNIPAIPNLTEQVSTALYSLVLSVAHSMPRDISRTGVATLNTLGQSGPLRLTRLAELEGVTQPTMTTLVDKLEQAGLVERRPDSRDGRAILINLTEHGRSYLRQRRRIGARRLTDLIEGLPEEQIRVLVQALPAIAQLGQTATLLTSSNEAVLETVQSSPR